MIVVRTLTLMVMLMVMTLFLFLVLGRVVVSLQAIPARLKKFVLTMLTMTVTVLLTVLTMTVTEVLPVFRVALNRESLVPYSSAVPTWSVVTVIVQRLAVLLTRALVVSKGIFTGMIL
jgi:hypothetical protein